MPVYEEYFSDEDMEYICEKYHLRIIVFDPDNETIELWKK